jgi:hypothetical protein
MKNIYHNFSVVFVLGWIFLSACTTPPTDEMNKAQDAVIRAENDADAVNYAPNTLIHARDALVRMQNEADAKRYDAAKNFAAEAISSAEKAIADGKTGVERARAEATNLLNSLQGTIEETQSTVNAARDVPNLQVDFDSIFRDMDLARIVHDEAWLSLRAADYRDTITKGQTVRSLLSDINARINEAAQDTFRKQ